MRSNFPLERSNFPFWECWSDLTSHSSCSSRTLPDGFANKAITTMPTNALADDIGAYVVLTQNHTVSGTVAGEFVIVVDHKVDKARASNNRTTLAVVKDQAAVDAVAAAAHTDGADNVAAAARRLGRMVLTDLPNTTLARVIGAGDRWKALFDSSTPRLKPVAASQAQAPAPAAAPGSDLVGKKFTGDVAVLQAGDIEYINAEWTVESVDSSGKLKLTASAGGNAHSALISVAFARACIKPVTVVVTDVDVDVSAYTAAASLLHFGITSGNMSARLIMRMATAAGMVLPAQATDGAASDAVLRRYALSVVDSWETWLNDPAVAGRQQVAPADEAAAVQQLKHARPDMLGGQGTPNAVQGSGPWGGGPNGVHGGGTGIGSGPDPTGVLAAAPAPAVAPAAVSGGTVGGAATTTPRYDALMALAADAAVRAELTESLMDFAEPDAVARARLVRYPISMASSIERWLRQYGAATDPILLCGR